MSKSALYLKAAEDFRDNPGQLGAYESTGHCVVLAGPGSGKTKTLTVKLARMLAEDVHEPRGVACITYNNECARELETRLADLGIQPGSRVFIGTVHSFSLTQIVIPYEKPAGLNLPDNFKVASVRQQRAAMELAYVRTINGPDNPHRWRLPMDRYRRSILNRASDEWQTQDPMLANLVEAYEAELRRNGLIDFDDMPLLALRALINHKWVRKAVLAKYPVLAVDEYQDLGHALHHMVLGLCFRTGIRLFAVGDADQSIYGFTGANPELLRRLSARQDVQTLRLPFNYRCGSQIVAASEYALGEDRGYQAPDGAAEGTIYFHPLTQDYRVQANRLFTEILPDVMNRIPDLTLGQIAVLYQSANIGNDIADAAEASGIEYVRTDGNALYPRYSRVMRWLEFCAIWSCGGWRNGEPRLSKIVADAMRVFADLLVSDDQKTLFQGSLVQFLWSHRNADEKLHDWMQHMKVEFLNDLLNASIQLVDEVDILNTFIEKLTSGGPIEDMTLGQFSGHGQGTDQITLSTLHSSKGREFRVVFLFGMDQGVIPWNNVGAAALRESRRLFYVGFTRAEQELHIIHSKHKPSQFVVEVAERIGVT
ncbi:ATP-dependent helicase [Nitrosomonas marina]|uniref:DNA 3'-5' helicase n=1 Tax=Nitrosomonas marina TaxID=917 RepID=A0A1H8HU35_9PROT|nr:ATP-dependent helicase [Nitrosomonas marina]SEN59531.1 DNA helicase-2 / ATP-dependent DNA helicase PcrA [Nitrosomonas marina]